MNDKDPLMYLQFCYPLQKYEEELRATIYIPRKPGKQIEVERTGDSAYVIIPDINKVMDA